MIPRNVWIPCKETSRTYVFPNARHTVHLVNKVMFSTSGTHYLETESGEKQIVNKGWMAIEIDAKNWDVTPAEVFTGEKNQ